MEGLKCKNEKKYFKMQRPNMALTQNNGIRSIGLSFLRDQKRREEEKRKREKKRKRKRKRRRREEKKKGR